MLYAFEVKVCMMFPDSCLTNNRFFLKKKKNSSETSKIYKKKKFGRGKSFTVTSSHKLNPSSTLDVSNLMDKCLCKLFQTKHMNHYLNTLLLCE